jgi:CBS domain-containing protein
MVPLAETPVFRSDEQLLGAFERLGGSELNRGLVLDGDRLVGLLSITDVARALEVGGPPAR